MKRKLMIALIPLLSCLIGALVPVLMATLLYARQPDVEAEYWRGVYDVCLAQTRQPVICLNSVAGFRARGGWYEQPSPGYAWPLPPAGPNRRDPAQQARPEPGASF